MQPLNTSAHTCQTLIPTVSHWSKQDPVKKSQQKVESKTNTLMSHRFKNEKGPLDQLVWLPVYQEAKLHLMTSVLSPITVFNYKVSSRNASREMHLDLKVLREQNISYFSMAESLTLLKNKKSTSFYITIHEEVWRRQSSGSLLEPAYMQGFQFIFLAQTGLKYL